MTVLYFMALFLFLLLSGLLCLVILVQESKSSGLGASFGGESGESLFGTSTPDILKKITTWLAVAFLAGCLILSLWTSALWKSRSKTPVKTEMIEE